MNSFSLQVSQKSFPNLRENKKARVKITIIKDFSVYRLQKIVLADRSASSLSFVLCLQHMCVLNHWTVYFRFMELISETPTAPFITFFILLFQGFACYNKGRSVSLRRIAKHGWRCSGFSLFVLFSPFLPFLPNKTLVQQLKYDISNSATQD
ncbi:hypothetical protein H5410_003294 [Solanum commersonii]|uniref:Uncharacterized protein n=1 Tax=Solanum commersonii TaxID=4109 RepID=A0A9J6B4F1_SOLCO|nr:hypothetical protein H5410_003294 [Solanum commersonii]